MLLDATHHAALHALNTGAEAPRQSGPSSVFVPLKGRREPAVNEPVKVYRNLNNGLYSVQAMAGPDKGRVLGYAASIGITKVEMKVGEKARQTVVEKGIRHVHAYSCGLYLGCADTPPAAILEAKIKVTYQPFVASRFFLRDQPDRKVLTVNEAWAYGADLWCDSLNEIGFEE